MHNNILSRMADSSIKPNKAALLLIWGVVAVAAGRAQAAIHTWDGGHGSGRWDHVDNWDTPLPTVPIVDNTADIKIAGTIQLDQYLRKDATIKSLEFTSSNTGATQIGLVAGNGTSARYLTFSADSGNCTLTVDASAGGDKTLGSWGGVVSPGAVKILSDLDIAHNGSGSLIFAKGIEGGSRNITLTGSGTTVFSGSNTYTGNTTVDGALTLSDGAQLAFALGTNGVNNTLSGSGTVVLNGDFLLDLRRAGVTPGDSWQLVDVGTLTETFGPTFSLASTAGPFAETNGVWSITEYGADYEFDESTGLLTVVNALPAADWMSGKWGIGWRFRADDKDQIANWDVDTLVSQVKSIPGDVDYVVFNLSDGAHGDAYIAPHSVLSVITTNSTPNDDRDLFMEMAQGFQTNGIKVIAYVAAQGPAMLKHGAESAFDSVEVSPGVFTSQAMDNWSNYVYSVYNITNFADEREMYKRAFGEVIIDEYAARYGSLIDGWWFDNGATENFDAPLLYSIVKQHNPHAAVGTNSKLSYDTDFLNGHPTPLQQYPANDQINLPMLTAIEATPDGYLYKGTKPNLGHMFMALGELWNSGDIVWPLDQAADWMTRCLNADGAWTWNVDLTDTSSIIRADMATFLTDLNVEIDAMLASNTAAPTFSQDSYDGGNAEFGVAYAGSIAGMATDADGDTLTYALAAGPDWLVVSTNGSLSGTPYNTLDLGMNRFTLVAADGNGLIDLAELEIYVKDEFGNDRSYSQISFNDLRGDLLDATINGLDANDPNVNITKATNGNDAVLSFSISNQNFDGGNDSDDSLSWDIRVKGFSGGTYTLNGTNSSVTLGGNVFVGTTSKEFGVSGNDLRYVGDGESIQFSVENVSLTAAPNATRQFDGFDDIWGTAGTYILGTGTGLESMTLAAGTNVSLPSPTVLTLTGTANGNRLKNLDGGFTIYPNNDPYFLAIAVESYAVEGTAYSNTVASLGASATDADGDSLTYSMASGPAWLGVDSDGTLTGTPTTNDVGLNVFTVEVSDGKAGTDQVVLNMTVVKPLLAHWTLDDGSGTTAVDAAGNGYDGTIFDGVWTNGVNGGALDFNGTSSQVTIPSMAFDAINNEISIAMWVHGAETQPRNDSLFYAANANGDRILNIILPWNSSSVIWDAGNAGAGYDRINKVVGPSDFMGAWNHWVFTKNAAAGEMEIYLNGALWHDGTGKTNTIVGIADATFGSRIANLFYDGMMDDVKLYGIALSAPEVAALFEEYSMNGIPVRWLSDYDLPITDSVGSEDPDGDALVTLAEYALGGVPTNAAHIGHPISTSLFLAGGTNWFEYVHPRRRDLESELNYILESSFNLVSNDWETATYEELPVTGNLDAEFEAVTNRFDTAGKTNEFIRLRIDTL